MPKPTDSLYRRVVENPKATARDRLAALKMIAKPTYAMLERLVSDPRTPARLAKAAADAHALRQALEPTPATPDPTPKDSQ
jgi:hypothetical protein